MHWLIILIISAQALPPAPTWVAPEIRRKELAGSVVEVQVELPAQPHVTRTGPKGPVGAAVLLAPSDGEGDPVLLTAEFLVRGARKIMVRTPAGSWPSKVLRADAREGLAQLEIPAPLRAQLQPRHLADPEIIAYQGYSMAEGKLLRVATHGRGAEQRQWYWRLTPNLPGGHAFFDHKGDVVGIYALQTQEAPEYGFAILGEPIARFLRNAPEEPARTEPLRITVDGKSETAP